MISLIKKIIPELYKTRLKEKLGVPTLHRSLLHLRDRGFNPAAILDVGAYEGNWTREVLEIFPHAKVLMVEAQKNKEAYLRNISNNKSNVDFAITLVSAKDGDNKMFREDETDSKIIDSGVIDIHLSRVTQTIDTIVSEKKFPYPDLLKLDVQGHELEALKGAGKSLEHAEVCLLEVSLINIGDHGPLLAEVIAFMDNHNFQAFDISQIMRRPFDNAVYQLDVFFAKKTSSLISTIRWS